MEGHVLVYLELDIENYKAKTMKKVIKSPSVKLQSLLWASKMSMLNRKNVTGLVIYSRGKSEHERFTKAQLYKKKTIIIIQLHEQWKEKIDQTMVILASGL